MRQYFWIPVLILVLLWSLLSPGHILSLDQISTPTISAPVFGSGLIMSALPVREILYALGSTLPGWIVQKFFLLVLFVLLCYLPWRYLPPAKESSGRIWATLFYVLNPLVYERFLAGHWTFLFGYALLPGLVAAAIGLFKEPRPRQAAKVAAWGLLLGAFSIHLFVMAAVMALPFAAVVIWRHPSRMKAARALALTTVIIVLGSAYWTIPILLGTGGSRIATFDASHWEVFKPAGDSGFSVVANILTLRGFWLEREPWIRTFIAINKPGWLWIGLWIIIGSLVITGIISGWRRKETRSTTVGLLTLAFMALIFACGVADTPFALLNRWLFEHVPFWRGFRDTQKWSAWLALAYAVFGGWGVAWLQQRWERSPVRKTSKWLLGAAFVSVLLLGRPMYFGFAGQLHPVWYPAGWAQADAILRQDPDCRAVFFPWHAYLTFNFADNRLIANPARAYFHCRILTSERVELGTAVDNFSGSEQQVIYGLLTSCIPPDRARAQLRDLGIRYVIYSPEVKDDPEFNYSFLNDPLWPVSQTEGLFLVALQTQKR